MDKQREPLRRGDNVKVKFATHDGFVMHSAIVRRNTPDQLIVVFASGFPYSVPHGEDRYEPVGA